jgi:YD repeat-containing protein
MDASLLTATVYPDSTDSLSADSAGAWVIDSGSDHTSATYDGLGRALTSTDQRGVVHGYGYDSAGRLKSDAVTTLPSGVDDSIRRIDRADLIRGRK